MEQRFVDARLKAENIQKAKKYRKGTGDQKEDCKVVQLYPPTKPTRTSLEEAAANLVESNEKYRTILNDLLKKLQDMKMR